MTRRGHTVIELLIAVTVGAVVIAMGATVGFRHQRFHRDIVIAVERSEQLDQLGALVPIALRSIVPQMGDVAEGAARDTSIEFRATIVSAVICDSVAPGILLAPADGDPRLASLLARPAPGDTAWLLDASFAEERWEPRAITEVIDAPAACSVGGVHPNGAAVRPLLALRLVAPPPSNSRVVRVTRPWRYSLYRASDGAWYLGAKDWNTPQRRFNAIQPVAGPLLPASAGGLRFRYLDSLGQTISPAPEDSRSIAAIQVDFMIDSVLPGRYAHAASIRGGSNVIVALRSRGR